MNSEKTNARRIRRRGIDAASELRGLLGEGALVDTGKRLATLTTWGVGGVADIFVEPHDEEGVRKVINFCEDYNLPRFVLGRGSNVLFGDEGLRGVVMRLSRGEFVTVRAEGDRIYCGAGAGLKGVVGLACNKGLTGLEYLEGIPGTVGGALRMNAGTSGRGICDVLDSLRYVDRDGEAHERGGGQLKYGYRSCDLPAGSIITSAVLRPAAGSTALIAERVEELRSRRMNSQPSGRSAGCVFKNTADDSAGRVIEECGLKGLRVGGAVLSDIHANFIINDGGANARDIIKLIKIIRDKVKYKKGIELKLEVQVVDAAGEMEGVDFEYGG